MIHIVWGYDASTAHEHTDVIEARECEAQEQALDAEARAEIAAEQANERFFEERGGGLYVGSPEEARDRFYDSLYA